MQALGISSTEKTLLLLGVLVAAFIGGYQLEIFNFEIDELILTEGIEKPLGEYLRVNEAYLPVLKVSMWISDRVFGGGPLAWRVPSYLSWICMIVVAVRFLLRSGAPYLALPFVVIVSLGDASLSYARWGMVSYSLSLLLLLLAFVVMSNVNGGHANSGIGFVALFPLCLALAFVYFGELVSLIVLGVVWVLVGGSHVVVRRGSVVFLMLLISCGYFLHFSDAGPGLEPRTSIKHLYFPHSGYESFFSFFLDRSSQLFAETFAFTGNVPALGKCFLGGGVFASICLHSIGFDQRQAVRWMLILALWIVGSVAAYAFLSYIGMGPYGSVRYLKGLIWAVPLLFLIGSGLIVRFMVEMIGKWESRFVVPLLVCAQVLCYGGGCVLVVSMVVSDRLKDREGFDRLASAMRAEADLVVVDELHSFAFRYLNPERALFTMSRGYVCEDGFFWNAYGWNPCIEMKNSPSAEVLDEIELEKPNRILVVSRGRFTAISYPKWFSGVSIAGYLGIGPINYKGPYVEVWERSL